MQAFANVATAVRVGPTSNNRHPIQRCDLSPASVNNGTCSFQVNPLDDVQIVLITASWDSTVTRLSPIFYSVFVSWEADFQNGVIGQTVSRMWWGIENPVLIRFAPAAACSDVYSYYVPATLSNGARMEAWLSPGDSIDDPNSTSSFSIYYNSITPLHVVAYGVTPCPTLFVYIISGSYATYSVAPVEMTSFYAGLPVTISLSSYQESLFLWPAQFDFDFPISTINTTFWLSPRNGASFQTQIMAANVNAQPVTFSASRKTNRFKNQPLENPTL